MRASAFTADGMQDFDVLDLSKGGMQLCAARPLGSVGHTLEIMLSLPDGSQEVTMMAEVMRVTADPHPHPKGDLSRWQSTLVGLKFLLVEPKQQEMLNGLIDKLLGGAGAGARAHARLSRRVEVVCKSDHELVVTLRDIGKGGLSFFSADDLSLEEHVETEIVQPGATGVLQLAGRIVHLSLPDDAGLRHVGVKFDQLSPSLEARLAALIAHFAHEEDAT
jgi:c-di-GMP-binding flagellar brake protein YcgR